MLYGYPATAATNNWIHDSVREILESIHSSLDVGESPRIWPEILPVAYRGKLRNLHALKARVHDYQTAVSLLERQERLRIAKALEDGSQISLLLSGVRDCCMANDLPETTRRPIAALFDIAFRLLGYFGVRDNLYREIYNALPYRICPFCGSEYFDAPGGAREDLDHYLAKKRYPFAAANLRNLIPMGSKCNSRYKHAQDIIRTRDGLRRRAFDPYATRRLKVSLERSQLFAGTDGTVPAWKIDFQPNSDEVKTWDDVFAVRERFQRNVLDPSFTGWLREFGEWCRCAGSAATTPRTLLRALKFYSQYLESLGLNDRAFLKAAMFRMLQRHCESGNRRLNRLLLDVVANDSRRVN